MSHHSTVHRPAVCFPDHVVGLDDMQRLARSHYGAAPHFERIQAMIANTEIETRRFVVPLDRLEVEAGLARRADLYLEHALPMATRVSLDALGLAGVEARDVDAIIMVSCTSFIMPSLDAYLINRIGLPRTIMRMPIAQLGCAAGASALIKANDYCRAYPDARVLIVCVELSSLCFFPEHQDLTSAVCASIFGDGAAACVVTGRAAGSPGSLQLCAGLTYTEPHSEHFIRYAITDAGYHLTLDRRVMHAITPVVPLVEAILHRDLEVGPHELDFVIAHTGGRRILDGLVEGLRLDPSLVEPSRASLREVGNTASVSIIDVIRRTYERGAPCGRGGAPANGLLVAFGPGFTMDALTARWSEGS